MTHIDICRFMDGVHHPGIFCTHEREEDETGLVYPVEWTVQQENQA
jgi:hypothetical protein